MTLLSSIRTIAVLLAAATLFAQTESQTQTPAPKPPPSTANDVAFPVAHAKPKVRTPKSDLPLFNLDTIVLDPAHGGTDNGAKISDNTLEKDVNLAFANRLKTLLAARGFNVIQTRTADPADLVADQRVEIANRSRAFACILIHASNGGHGVHIFTSALNAAPQFSSDPSDPRPIVAWDTAQAAAIPNSLRLADDLSTALNNIRVPLVLGRASVSPIDSMTCPAIALELAPLATDDGETPASDEAYQSRVAEAVAAGLAFWRGHAQSISAAAQPAQSATSPAGPATPPVKKPRPKLVTPPVEVPDEPGPAQRPPAPIVRKPPPPDVPPPGGAR